VPLTATSTYSSEQVSSYEQGVPRCAIATFHRVLTSNADVRAGGRLKAAGQVGGMIAELVDQSAGFDSRMMSGRMVHCRVLSWTFCSFLCETWLFGKAVAGGRRSIHFFSLIPRLLAAVGGATSPSATFEYLPTIRPSLSLSIPLRLRTFNSSASARKRNKNVSSSPGPF
jgi:hypothetical protein